MATHVRDRDRARALCTGTIARQAHYVIGSYASTLQAGIPIISVMLSLLLFVTSGLLQNVDVDHSQPQR
jgi:hypothetical protein